MTQDPTNQYIATILSQYDLSGSMLPDYRLQPESFIAEVKMFLDQHRAPYGIVLDAYRRLNLLKRSATGTPS